MGLLEPKVPGHPGPYRVNVTRSVGSAEIDEAALQPGSYRPKASKKRVSLNRRSSEAEDLGTAGAVEADR